MGIYEPFKKTILMGDLTFICTKRALG